MIVGNEETLVNMWYEWLLRENTDCMTRPFQDNRHVLDPCTLDHDTAVLTAVVTFLCPWRHERKIFFYLMDRETNYKCTSCTATFWISFFSYLQLHLFLFPHPPMDFVRNLDFSQQTPFGFHLYPIFEKAYQAVTGQAAADFAFVPGVTPLSTVKEGKKERNSR